ncbi:hypothetical protein TTHERM_00643410 (macronuclear) [Tetrahymena thermophila SB210]|uniref:Uncharacterized protein n=1 Tax=Tetrahymena thermophila (strain SB210) TaxID=312017 RepID=Q23EZ0_TETTS|nr:hypothetical protein TTHERM_00643410 [Tetrahymena thermophila SB210]EAR95115.1 hypothetical protein TTHERM_00643410 [Tetrahymena thermophila SB210]|eukprot:XP_001015360.1 hypothetical protein TTHERM_00643410 [Tetrahymena thermophila SB210]
MRNAIDKNKCRSPISFSKSTQKSRLELLSLCKPNIQHINTKLNSTLSPQHIQPKIKQSQDSQQIQSPSKTNKFFVFNSQNNQSPKTKNNKSSYQLEKNQFQQKFNLSKIESSFQQKSSFDKNSQQRRDHYLINKKYKTQDDDNLKSDVESEEEISIWEENKLKTQFIDSRGGQLDFYQIYRLRSALYQQTCESPINTIQDVQILSQHFNKEIPIEQLQQQQSYLDKYYEIQKKNYANQQQQNKQNQQKFIKKCQTQRIERSKTSYEKNEFNSTKQKQQISKQQQKNLSNKPQKELLHDQFEKIQKYLQNNDLQKEKEKNLQCESYLSQEQHRQQYNSQRRHKINIYQEQISKLIQTKIVPVRYIDLTDDDDDYDDDEDDDGYNCQYTNQNKILDNAFSEYYNKQELQKEYKNTEIDISTDDKQLILKNEKQLSNQQFTETGKSILSSLQKTISCQTNCSQKNFSNTKLNNLTKKSINQNLCK